MAVPREVLDRVVKEMVDRGKLIEAGWLALKAVSIPEDAPAIQLEETRNAFFAGAQHCFGSIMQMLDSGTEATEQDLKRMDLINTELNDFLRQYKAKKFTKEGRA